MRRPWLAGTLLVAGAAAILVLWFGFGGDRAPHVHAGEGSSVIAGAVTGAAATSAAAPADAPATGSAAPSATSTGGDHAGHAPAASSTPPAEPVTTAVPDDPDAAAADRRQVGLAEAAGAAGAPSATGSATAAAPAADRWIDADAAGVNEGTKQQAAGVVLAPATVVDPSQVLPSNGLTNGCVAGYGRGAQCLPQTPPSHAGHGVGDMSIYWTCAEARTLLPDGIVVDTPGTDPLGLDSNGDGTACGAGDR